MFKVEWFREHFMFNSPNFFPQNKIKFCGIHNYILEEWCLNLKNKKIISQIEKTPVYGYASNVLNGTIVANEYIKIACKDFIDELNDPNSKYIFSYKSLKSRIIAIFSGLKVNLSLLKIMMKHKY